MSAGTMSRSRSSPTSKGAKRCVCVPTSCGRASAGARRPSRSNSSTASGGRSSSRSPTPSARHSAAAIGFALGEDALGLVRFRERYVGKMGEGPDRRAFDVVTAPVARAARNSATSPASIASSTRSMPSCAICAHVIRRPARCRRHVRHRPRAPPVPTAEAPKTEPADRRCGAAARDRGTHRAALAFAWDGLSAQRNPSPASLSSQSSKWRGMRAIQAFRWRTQLMGFACAQPIRQEGPNRTSAMNESQDNPNRRRRQPAAAAELKEARAHFDDGKISGRRIPRDRRRGGVAGRALQEGGRPRRGDRRRDAARQFSG